MSLLIIDGEGSVKKEVISKLSYYYSNQNIKINYLPFSGTNIVGRTDFFPDTEIEEKNLGAKYLKDLYGFMSYSFIDLFNPKPLWILDGFLTSYWLKDINLFYSYLSLRKYIEITHFCYFATQDQSKRELKKMLDRVCNNTLVIQTEDLMDALEQYLVAFE